MFFFDEVFSVFKTVVEQYRLLGFATVALVVGAAALAGALVSMHVSTLIRTAILVSFGAGLLWAGHPEFASGSMVLALLQTISGADVRNTQHLLRQVNRDVAGLNETMGAFLQALDRRTREADREEVPADKEGRVGTARLQAAPSLAPRK